MPNETPSLFSRIINSDSARRGVAGAVAGILVATISEILWPTES